jgi:hypothetical protein
MVTHLYTRSPCMGGWCPVRDRCFDHEAKAPAGIKPEERRCERGHEQPVSAPLVQRLPVGAAA